MKEIRLKARAKINISLDVLGKRPDGYHDLSMIMQTINLYDKVTLRIGSKKAAPIVLKTNLAFLPTDSKNLVYRVVEFMKNKYEIKDNIYIDLFKVIPVGAGLAGGSANAAAAIKAMNRLFNLNLQEEEMKEIGKQFGADIPYCIMEGTMLAEGIGDILTPLSKFPDCSIVVVKPYFGVSTAFVYNNLDLGNIRKRPDNEFLKEAIKEKNINKISENMVNVLEEVTVKEYPIIEKIKEALIKLGAEGAIMSGSGSAVFGIFENKEKAKIAAISMKKQKYVKFANATTVYNRERG